MTSVRGSKWLALALAAGVAVSLFPMGPARAATQLSSPHSG